MVFWLQEALNDSFQMKGLGPLTYFLGLEVHKIKEGLLINQQKDAKDLIFQARLQNSTPVDTPLELNVKYRIDYGNLLAEPSVENLLAVSFT